VLRSAVHNAEVNHGLSAEELVVHAAYADEGVTMKRWKPRARGRANRIFKRTAHITILLAQDERLAEAAAARAAAAAAAEAEQTSGRRRRRKADAPAAAAPAAPEAEAAVVEEAAPAEPEAAEPEAAEAAEPEAAAAVEADDSEPDDEKKG
jgi:large subunit ribosomal protein L22